MRYTLLLLSTLVAVSFGCDTNPGSTSPAHQSVGLEPENSLAGLRYEDASFTYDAHLNAISKDFPGFKALFASDDGSNTFIVVGAPLSNARNNSALIQRVSERLSHGPGALRIVSSREYSAMSGVGVERSVDAPDFHVLYSVKVSLRRFLFADDQAISLDVDEARGRVAIEASSQDALEVIRSQMTDLELMHTDLSVGSMVRPQILLGSDGRDSNELLASASSLRSLRNDVFNPLVSGSEISQFVNISGFPQEGRCTVGPVVRYGNSSWGFLTASHCTTEYYEMEGTPHYQPSVYTGTIIGYEAAEQQRRSCTFCSKGFYADVAFVRTVSGLGLVGRSVNSTNCSDASCLENGVEDKHYSSYYYSVTRLD